MELPAHGFMDRFLAVVPSLDLAPGIALLLLVGGLSMLSLIVVLAIIQNILPRRLLQRNRKATNDAAIELRPTRTGSPRGAPAQTRDRPMVRKKDHPPIDRALDVLVDAGLGEPRVLALRANFAFVRLYGCRSCKGASPGGQGGCTFECGSIETAFRSVYGKDPAVREVNCGLDGHPTCEFEVRF